MILMRKVAQDTYFDKVIQTNPSKLPARQRLLFPTQEGFHEVKDEDIVEPLQPLELEYPELKPEHISTHKITPDDERRIIDEIAFEKTRLKERAPAGKSYLEESQKLLDDDKTPDVVKSKVLEKYNELKTKSIEFYSLYREANALAGNVMEVDTTGTYAELFRQFGKLVANELTREIGRLFGVYAKESKMTPVIKDTFKKGINIFNITSLNFSRKIREMDALIDFMNSIIADYNHRKKLIKHLHSKIDAEITNFLDNAHWQKFLVWMDEYFPYHKDEFVNEAIKKIQRPGTSGGEYNDTSIQFGDLVKFKTFKAIYEKAGEASGYSFKKEIDKLLLSKVEEELNQQVRQRVVLRLEKIISFINNVDPESEPLEQITHIIFYFRKIFNIDLRAIFAFAKSVNEKKQQSNYPTTTESPSAQAEMARLEAKGNKEFLLRFLSYLKGSIDNYIKDINSPSSAWQDPYKKFNKEIYEFVKKIIHKHNSGFGIENLQQIVSLNTQNLDSFANQFIFTVVINAIPGFASGGPVVGYSDYMSEDNNDKGSIAFFTGIKEILEESGGKFSIESIASYVHQYIPFAPKELLASSIKTYFKNLDNRSLNRMSLFKGTDSQDAMHMLVVLMKRDGKLDHNNFVKVLTQIVHYTNVCTRIRVNLPKAFQDKSEVVNLIVDGIKNFQSLDKDLENLEKFTKFIHDETGQLSDEIIRKMVMNKNFANYSKVGIVRKLMKSYAQIKNLLGVDHIFKTFGKIINDLQAQGLLSPDFKENLILIEKIFESNEEVSPKSPEFTKLFAATSKIESDLAILQMGDALKDLLSNYQPKDENLFKLNYSFNDKLRFRVLGNKDPRILRIGIETDCCQRIGGAGEVAARDSFINPLSSVVILEWFNSDEDEWQLLTQSYFHYVPKDNGYILDNVESNSKNVREFLAQSPLSMEEIYAIYAEKMKAQTDTSYFLAGKGFSKINTQQFKTNKSPTDPRSFDNRSLTPKNKDHYSDYNEKDSINLLAPKFNVAKAEAKISSAHQIIRNFIKAVLSPPTFFKTAQQTATPAAPTAPATPAVVAPSPSSQEDIKSLPGVQVHLFGPQSWMFVNQFMNTLNGALYNMGQGQKLGEQTINFQTVVKNPSGETRFTGGLKGLFQLATRLWNIVTVARNTVYSVVEAQNIINQLMALTDALEIEEAVNQSIKPKLVNILNNWSAILK